jgi:maltose alpha-D-glucosyltransferase/alpha-amylase
MLTLPLTNSATLQSLLENAAHRSELINALSTFLDSQRWFAAKTEGIQNADILDSVSIPAEQTSFELVLVTVTTNGGATVCYALPLTVLPDTSSEFSESVIALLAGEMANSSRPASLIECSGHPEFWRALTRVLADASLTTRNGRTLKLSRTSSSQFSDLTELRHSTFTIHDGEQSNSAVAIGDDFFLKLFRRPRVGLNPDAEVGIFLTDRTGFTNSPRVDATIDILGDDGHRCLAMISEQVPAETSAWACALDSLKEFWNRLAELEDQPESPPRLDSLDHAAVTQHGQETERLLNDLMGDFRLDVVQLGRRTAELHTALSSCHDDPAFAPQPLTQESIHQLVNQIRHEIQSTCELLEKSDRSTGSFANLPQKITQRANTLLDAMSSFDPVQANVVNIRCHGDYHLGQVLRTESDFVILDFEGEPDRPFDERRQKRCALKDVAGMIRSLHYASCAAKVGMLPGPAPTISNPGEWQKFWFDCASAGFLAGYTLHADGKSLFPKDRVQRQQLLDLFLIEKVLYEIRYETNNRPDWLPIPLSGLKAVLGLDA